MPLSAAHREYVIATAVDLLRHRQRERVIAILAERLAHGDYPDPVEADLDRIALAIARAVDEQLGER